MRLRACGARYHAVFLSMPLPMPLIRTIVLPTLLIAPAAVWAQDSANNAHAFDAQAVDIAALIRCEGTPEQFASLAASIQEPLNAVALGWRPLPKANMFLTEFALNQGIEVFGHRSDHIAFADASVMAVLDMPDPRPLARQLDLETGLDTPEKVLFGKERVSEEFKDPDTGRTMLRSAVLNVSNVTSHPGRTLVGCSYSIEPLEDEPAAAPDAG